MSVLNEERLINLETKISHQEVLIEELNSVLYEQQKAIENMEKSLAAFIKKYKELEKATQGPGDQKPPHY